MFSHTNIFENRFLRFPLYLLLALTICLKIVLLFSSQSMADGDEAVEGIMAMHVLEHGIHKIYPYGVNYGAGAFLEVHLASLIFKIFGVSDIALKASGLIIWLMCLTLLYLVAKAFYGTNAAMMASLLYGISPQGAQWSLKVAGGHQVAVLCCLILILSRKIKFPVPLVAALIPLAAFSHPITLPLVIYIAIDSFVRTDSMSLRIRLISWLFFFSCIVAYILWPETYTVWNPGSSGFSPGIFLTAISKVVITLFSPNLNSCDMPAPPYLIVSVIWLGVFILASVHCIARDRKILEIILAVFAVILIVKPELLVPRHLLMIYPISCIIISGYLISLPLKWILPVLGTLMVSGGLVQINEIRAACIYGPSPQDVGIERNHLRNMVNSLLERKVYHVYCLDPMLQWNIIFESRERIIARWIDPHDRMPGYPIQVDLARREGKPFAVVYEIDRCGKKSPQRFAIAWQPDPKNIDRVFRPVKITGSSYPVHHERISESSSPVENIDIKRNPN